MSSRRKRTSDQPRLPQGAEAALWSIVEVIPDPRNHLALTRDPTAEVRLSAEQLDAAAAASVPAAAASPALPPPPSSSSSPPPPAAPAPPGAEAVEVPLQAPALLRAVLEARAKSGADALRWSPPAPEAAPSPGPVTAPPARRRHRPVPAATAAPAASSGAPRPSRTRDARPVGSRRCSSARGDRRGRPHRRRRGAHPRPVRQPAAVVGLAQPRSSPSLATTAASAVHDCGAAPRPDPLSGSQYSANPLAAPAPATSQGGERVGHVGQVAPRRRHPQQVGELGPRRSPPVGRPVERRLGAMHTGGSTGPAEGVVVERLGERRRDGVVALADQRGEQRVERARPSFRRRRPGFRLGRPGRRRSCRPTCAGSRPSACRAPARSPWRPRRARRRR